MGYDGQRLMDVRLQGFSQNQAVAMVQKGVETSLVATNESEVVTEGASWTHDLGSIQKITDPFNVDFSPNGTAVIKFHIEETSMASFWANPGDSTTLVPLDLSLTISGSNLAEAYRSDKGTGSGESISLQLVPGDYVLTLRDETNYTNFPITPSSDKPWIYQHFRLALMFNRMTQGM